MCCSTWPSGTTCGPGRRTPLFARMRPTSWKAYRNEVRRQKVMDKWREKCQVSAVPSFPLGPVDNHDPRMRLFSEASAFPVPKLELLRSQSRPRE